MHRPRRSARVIPSRKPNSTLLPSADISGSRILTLGLSCLNCRHLFFRERMWYLPALSRAAFSTRRSPSRSHGGADAEFLFWYGYTWRKWFSRRPSLDAIIREGIGKPAKVIFPNQTVIYLPFIEAGIPRTVIGHRRAGDVSLSRQIPV